MGLNGSQCARVILAAYSPAFPSTASTTYPTCPQPEPLTSESLPSPQLHEPSSEASMGPGKMLGTGLLSRAHGADSGWDRQPRKSHLGLDRLPLGPRLEVQRP